MHGGCKPRGTFFRPCLGCSLRMNGPTSVEGLHWFVGTFAWTGVLCTQKGAGGSFEPRGDALQGQSYCLGPNWQLPSTISFFGKEDYSLLSVPRSYFLTPIVAFLLRHSIVFGMQECGKYNWHPAYIPDYELGSHCVWEWIYQITPPITCIAGKIKGGCFNG